MTSQPTGISNAFQAFLSLNGRALCLACAKPDWHLSQKGPLNPLYL